MYWAGEYVHFPGEKSYHVKTMSFCGHRIELQTCCDIFKKDTHNRSTCVKLIMSASDKDAVHISAIQVCFPSWLTLIGTIYQLKLTYRYKNVSRALAYTWHGRFSGGSTNNTSCGLPKYTNLQEREVRARRHRLWLATHRTRSCWNGRY